MEGFRLASSFFILKGQHLTERDSDRETEAARVMRDGLWYKTANNLDTTGSFYGQTRLFMPQGNNSLLDHF